MTMLFIGFFIAVVLLSVSVHGPALLKRRQPGPVRQAVSRHANETMWAVNALGRLAVTAGVIAALYVYGGQVGMLLAGIGLLPFGFLLVRTLQRAAAFDASPEEFEAQQKQYEQQVDGMIVGSLMFGAVGLVVLVALIAWPLATTTVGFGQHVFHHM